MICTRPRNSKTRSSLILITVQSIPPLPLQKCWIILLPKVLNLNGAYRSHLLDQRIKGRCLRFLNLTLTVPLPPAIRLANRRLSSATFRRAMTITPELLPTVVDQNLKKITKGFILGSSNCRCSNILRRRIWRYAVMNLTMLFLPEIWRGASRKPAQCQEINTSELPSPSKKCLELQEQDSP